MSESDYYEEYWSESGFNPRREGPSDHLRKLFERFVGPEDDCLDLGCGDGGTSGPYLVAHSHSYVGVDVSEAAVALAQTRGLTALRIDDASSLPFDESSFDVVVCSEVLEHLFEPQLAAAEARRVLRPGGRFIVTVPNAWYWRDRFDALFGVWSPGGDDRGRAEPWRSPHVRFFRPGTLQAMLVSAGFDQVEIVGLPYPLLGRVPGMRWFSRRPGPLSRAAARVAPSLLAAGIAAIGICS